MKYVLRTAIAAVVCLGATTFAQAGLILVNFGSTAYTTDGTNTWQTVNLSDGTNFVDPGSVALVDTAGAGTGVTLDVAISGSIGVAPNGGASQAAFASPAVGTNPAWFDETSAEQRETFNTGASGGSNNNPIIYTFSGFNASDTVAFTFATGRSDKSTGPRTTEIILDAVVDQTVLAESDTIDKGNFATITGLTGQTSYTFNVNTSDLFSSVINAAAVEVTPIPEPASLALLGLGSLLMVTRRRQA